MNYVLDYSLPGATVAVREQEVTFVNSNFVDLTPDGEASIILIASNVTFQTANFSSNKQATAGPSPSVSAAVACPLRLHALAAGSY